MKDTVQELVDALDVMTTSILERIRNTWILRLKLKPETSDMFLTVSISYYTSMVCGCHQEHLTGRRRWADPGPAGGIRSPLWPTGSSFVLPS